MPTLLSMCAAAAYRRTELQATVLNRICVLVLTGDFLWSSLPILQAGINPDQEAHTMKHVKSLARRLSLRELCQKHIVWLRQ